MTNKFINCEVRIMFLLYIYYNFNWLFTNNYNSINVTQIILFIFFRILAYSPEELQFVAEIMWAKRDNGNYWVMSSRFHKFFLKQIDTRQINIRIMRIKTNNQALNPFFNQQIDPYFSHYYNNTLGF